MGFAKSGGESIWSKRQWQRKMDKSMQDDVCGHVWEWDPDDRIMRCYKCGDARMATDADKIPARVENGDTDF